MEFVSSFVDVGYEIVLALSPRSMMVPATLCKSWRDLMRDTAPIWALYYQHWIGQRAAPGRTWKESIKLYLHTPHPTPLEKMKKYVTCGMDVIVDKELKCRRELYEPQITRLLHISIEKKCLSVIDVILKQFPTILEADSFFTQLALSSGNLDVIQKVVPKANLLDPSLFIAAVKKGEISSVQRLINMGVDPNCSCNGDLPIFIAARKGYIELIDLLINKGVSINCQGKTKETPLDFAAKYSDLDTVTHLIFKGAEVYDRSDRSDNPYHVLFSSVVNTSAEIFLYLMRWHFRHHFFSTYQNKRKKNILEAALGSPSKESVKIVTLLMDHYCYNQCENMLLHTVRYTQFKKEEAKVLLKHGAELEYGIRASLQKNHLKAFKFFLKRTCWKREYGIELARWSPWNIIPYVVKSGYDLSYVDDAGYPIPHIMASRIWYSWMNTRARENYIIEVALKSGHIKTIGPDGKSFLQNASCFSEQAKARITELENYYS